jgi:hypothetical protein
MVNNLIPQIILIKSKMSEMFSIDKKLLDF